MAQYERTTQVPPQSAAANLPQTPGVRHTQGGRPGYLAIAQKGVEAVQVLKPMSVHWRDGVRIHAQSEKAKDLKYQDILASLQEGTLAGLSGVVGDLDVKSVLIGGALALSVLIIIKKYHWDRKLKLNRIGL